MLPKSVILVVDDSEVNRQFLSRILSQEYEVLLAENGQQAMEVLDQRCGNVAGIVLDLIMPTMDGYEFMEHAQKVEAYRNIPILVATADDGPDVENQCLQLGAWDFVRKPFNPNTVRLRLRNIIDRSRLHLLEQMRYMGDHDALTGLYNREKFFSVSRQMLDNFPQEQFVFIRLDLERFRLVNTFYGEEEGNRLLQFLADCLREMCANVPEEQCTYGRMEADVFCICRPHEENVIENLIKQCRQRLRVYAKSYYVEPVFGLYVIEDPHLNVETMYARACMAAEQCKNQYHSKFAYYTSSLSASAYQEQWIRNEMETALQERQFLVYYQPKYELKTDLPCGAEALVRWQHPTRGLISPGEFIPVFEHNGFVSKVDYYVWEEVCRNLRRWLNEGKTPLPISVNVSRVNMYNPNLVESLTELTKRYGVPNSLLHLELTESAYMDNPTAMYKTLDRLHEQGFLVMMDDFGSGYSSLNTLRDIQVDILKIDMKFLPTGGVDNRSERILVSIIRMAGWLGIPVIMEGVETRTQRDFLQSVGCGYVQGYYYARPMPVEDYERLVAQGQSDCLPRRMNDEENRQLRAIWSSQDDAELFFWDIWQPMAVCQRIGGQTSILRVNHAFLELFGYPTGSDTVEQMDQNLPETYRKQIDQSVEQAITQQGRTRCRHLCCLPDGRKLWLESTFQYLQDSATGSLLLMTLLDVTHEQELEEELARCHSAQNT